MYRGYGYKGDQRRVFLSNIHFNRLTLALIFALLASCGLIPQGPSVVNDEPKELSVFERLDQDYAEAIARSDLASRWHDGWRTALPLRVIGPVFRHPNDKDTEVYKYLNLSLRQLARQPTMLNEFFGAGFSDRFASVKYGRYELDAPYADRVNAALSNALKSEVTLNSVFADNQRPGMEMVVGYDDVAYQEGRLVLFGYKTVLEPGFDRNSAYFEIHGGELPEGKSNKLKLIFKCLSAAVSLSIPEYASIDRQLVLDTTNTQFVTEFGEQETFGHVYNSRQKQLQRNRQERLNALDKIDVITQTRMAKDLAVSKKGGLIAYTNKYQYLSSVWVGSAANFEQRSKILENSTWDSETKRLFFNDDGHLLIVDNYALRLYNTANNQFVYQSQKKEILDAYASKGGRIVAALHENSIALYEGDTGKLVSEYPIDLKEPQYIAVRPDARFAFVSNDAGDMQIYDLGKGLKSLNYTLAGSPLSMRYDDKGTRLYISASNGVLYRWLNGQIKPEILAEPGVSLTSLSLNHNQDRIVGRSDTGLIMQWSLDGTPLGSFQESGFNENDAFGGGSVVRFSRDDESLIYGGVTELQVKASETVEMVQNRFNQLEEAGKKATWLEASNAYQQIYPNGLSNLDLLRLHQVELIDLELANGEIAASQFSREQAKQILQVVGMALPDPMLIGSRPEIFEEALNIDNVTNVADENVRVVRYRSEMVSLNPVSVSRPRYDRWGYKYERLKVGERGFAPRILSSVAGDSWFDFDDVGVTEILLSSDLVSFYEAAANGKVIQRNLVTGEPMLEFQGHPNERINSMVQSPDQSTIITGASDGSIIEWSASSGFKNREYTGFTSDVGSLFYIDEREILSGNGDASIKLWDAQTGKPSDPAFLGHTGAVQYVSYDAALKQVVSAGDDGTVRVWQKGDRVQLRSFNDLGASSSVSYDPDSQSVLYQTANGEVVVKSIKSGQVFGRIPVEGTVTAAVLYPGGELVLVGLEDTIQAYEVSSGRLLGTMPNSIEAARVNNIQLSPDGQVALVAIGNTMEWWNIGWYPFKARQGW